MLIYVLGNVVVDDGAGQQISSGPAKRAGLLTALAYSVNSAVPQDELITRIWGEKPPRNATTLHSHLSRLRQLLSPHPEITLARIADGYRLEVDAEQIDLYAMHALASHAHGYREIGHQGKAAEQLREAAALWRGRPLAGLDSAWARQIEAELATEYRQLLESRFESEVEAGRHAEILTELSVAVNDHPDSQRLIHSLMLAQVRCGQSDEALRTFSHARRQWTGQSRKPSCELAALRDRIAHGDPALALPVNSATHQPPAAAAPRQLPPQPSGFIGREHTLREISHAFDRGDRCVLITGMAGVGKTAIALRWAHSMAGEYGVDGHLYVDMRGESETPTTAEDAAGVLLRALGVEGREMPTEAGERLQVFRSTVAGRRLFLLLDNVSSRRQIAQLVGMPNVSVLVTSRTHFSGFEGGHHIEVGLLSDAESRTLLARMLGEARVEQEAAAATELVVACGHLPLALRIAAANLQTEHYSSIAGFVADMSQRGLSRLKVAGDDTTAVGNAFALSYRKLSPCAGIAFGMLGMMPAGSFTLGAASALFGTSQALAAPLLDELTTAHLLESDNSGRCRFHDLVRLFAEQHARDAHVGADRDAALRRLCVWYATRTRAASEVLAPDFERLAMPEPVDDTDCVFLNYNAALSWMDAELHAIVAVTELAADRFPVLAPRLADHARAYLFIRKRIAEWITLSETGFAAAQRNDDSDELAAMHYMIGHCGSMRVDYDAALRHYPRAARHAKLAGNTRREASAQLKVANAAARAGRLDEAVTASQTAVNLTVDLDATLRGTALSVSGLVCYARGMLSESVVHFAKGAELARDDGNSNRVSLVGNLAVAHKERGQLDSALACGQEALSLSRERGARYQILSALVIIAEILILRGEDAHAVKSLDELFELLQSVDARLPRAEGLSSRAELEPDGAEAVRLATEAVRIGDETGDSVVRIETRLCLAERQTGQGAYSTARETTSEASAIAHETGFRNMKARTLTMHAQIDCAAGDLSSARHRAQRALTMHRENGNMLAEARSLMVLGRTEPDSRRARENREAAQRLLSECGARVPQLRAVELCPDGA